MFSSISRSSGFYRLSHRCLAAQEPPFPSVERFSELSTPTAFKRDGGFEDAPLRPGFENEGTSEVNEVLGWTLFILIDILCLLQALKCPRERNSYFKHLLLVFMDASMMI